MEFDFVDNLGITIDLNILRTVSQPFTIHLYQHQGSFSASNTHIGNGDDAADQFRYFFEEARQKESDLVLTPEYSCPWKNVIEIIQDEKSWPSPGKLWALGSESISKSDLKALATVCSHVNVFAHWEQGGQNSNKDFYDPLVYLFKGIHQGSEKLIVLVQFKTRHMGAWLSTLERDHLIEGSTIWVIKNSNDSPRFISIICSEAMNFQAQLTQEKMNTIGWNEHAFYIYNPQANPDPTHANFIDFRKFVISVDRKEIIALNWNPLTSHRNKGRQVYRSFHYQDSFVF